MAGRQFLKLFIIIVHSLRAVGALQMVSEPTCDIDLPPVDGRAWVVTYRGKDSGLDSRLRRRVNWSGALIRGD